MTKKAPTEKQMRRWESQRAVLATLKLAFSKPKKTEWNSSRKGRAQGSSATRAAVEQPGGECAGSGFIAVPKRAGLSLKRCPEGPQSRGNGRETRISGCPFPRA